MQLQPALCNGFCPSVSLLCSRINLRPLPGTPWAVTVGAGIELQAEGRVTAVQGTLLRLHAAVGPAHLSATRAATAGCVVRAGETIKLQ